MNEVEPTTQPVIHVEITSAGHSVTIDAPGNLNTITDKALELWRATDDAALTRGYGTSVGFHTELAVDVVELEETGRYRPTTRRTPKAPN